MRRFLDTWWLLPKPRVARLGVALLLGLLLIDCGGGQTDNNTNGGNSNGGNSNVVLPIAPVAQEFPEWCWLASGQMVFQYYQLPPVNPNYQCGIIGVFEGPQSACFFDCTVCDFGGGSANNVALMLQFYSNYTTKGADVLTFTFVPTYLSFQQVQTEIDAKRPILSGINVGTPVSFGNSGHLVVIVGYKVQSAQDFVIVNDPFPYQAAGYPDPYLSAGATQLQPGQYSIGYQTFIQSLAWNTAYFNFMLVPGSPAIQQQSVAHFGPDWVKRLESDRLQTPR